MRTLAHARRIAKSLRLCAEGGPGCEALCWYAKRYGAECQAHLLREAALEIDAAAAERKREWAKMKVYRTDVCRRCALPGKAGEGEKNE